ncbi:MAG: AAA family ATPase [Rhodoferax sp.]|nr:AAA family ATPase [Rhodoferax sp.]
MIENLRGSVTPFTLPFEKGKKLTIIYGENGTGKSTLSDALDLLGNGNVGSLATRGLGSTRKYWPSVGKKATDVKVTLKTSHGDCSVLLGKNEVVVTNEPLRPQVAVLRRSQILQLIEAKPAERYSAISRFIDVSGVEASEATLRKLILDKDREFNEATTRVSENRFAIERFWKEVGSPGSSATEWANREIQQDQTFLDKRKASIDGLISLCDRLLAYHQNFDGLANQLKAADSALEEAQKNLSTLEASMASDYLEVLELLKVAQTHFQNHPNPTVCPLCESSEKAKGLADEVNRRLQSQGIYSKLEAAQKTVASKNETIQHAKQRVQDLRASAAQDAAALEAYFNDADAPADVEKPTLPLPDEIAEWGTWIAFNQGKRAQWVEARDDKKFIGTLRTSLNALGSHEKRAKDLETILPRLKKTLELVENERKKFTDNILKAISKRVGELYEAIHPREGLNKIVLTLDAAKRASLEIASEFGGKEDAPPQAYFSDSHLDTLGLCVFLALAELDEPQDKLLVLDDVLGSVDEPHVDRIIDMVYKVAVKFRHCVVTTHYGPWRYKYRWGWLKNGQCQFIELSHWSIDKGMSYSRSIPESERLRNLLQANPPDHQTICAKSGVILEAVLDFLTQLYECSVPRRAGGHYTLGDLLPGIDKNLRKALRVEHRHEDASGTVSYQSRDLEPHLNEIIRIAQVRNVTGCHFNKLSFALPETDAIAFGREVLALADALIDHEAGWPKNDKSGSYWSTAGDTRRLHPLKKPS